MGLRVVTKDIEHFPLDLRVLSAQLPQPLSDLSTPPDIARLLQLDAPAALQCTEQVRLSMRGLLKCGGFKPGGRSRPAAEFLRRASEAGKLSSINLLVDAANAVSLHSGVSMSVFDLDRAEVAKDFVVAVGGPDDRYVFNRSGQVIELKGLLCLFDSAGPIVNAVKDAQRTKTDETTRNFVTVWWGSRECSAQVEAAYQWYRELMEPFTTGATEIPVLPNNA